VSATPKRRVLIVEDSAAMRHLLSLAVGRLPGAHIDEVGDGMAALKALKAAGGAPYDLVFLDLNMPVMDGLKLLGMMRGEPSVARTTFAVVTTIENAETERQARALGARYFVRKPVSRRAVDKILAEVFGWAATA
jgi:two-component system, chemotaxis family, chemotaxis protein CheY